MGGGGYWVLRDYRRPVNSSEFLVYKEVVRAVKDNIGICSLSKLEEVWM